MGSSESLATKGGEWKGSVVTFHTRTGYGYSDCSTETFMTHQVAKEIEDRQGNQKIEFVEVWDAPLYGWQLTMVFMNHQYVIFSTYSWWWSMEKTTSGIIIQRGKEKKFLQRYQGQERRATTGLLGRNSMQSSAVGRGTFSELVTKAPQELGRSYCLFDDNCKDFAVRIFDLASVGYHTKNSFSAKDVVYLYEK
eukprot:Selendium_serpulae@DN5853_c4_g2_i1.p1